MATQFGYKAALQWLIDNDDCYWLDEEDARLSVTAAFVADMFGKTDEELTKQLRKLWEG